MTQGLSLLRPQKKWTHQIGSRLSAQKKNFFEGCVVRGLDRFYEAQLKKFTLTKNSAGPGREHAVAGGGDRCVFSELPPFKSG